VQWKSNQSPVTVADQEAEQLLRQTLLTAFPQDGFLGEEFGETAGESGYRWIIDPIDGTRSFVRGIPLWATLVGLEFRGEPIAGVVFIPPLGQTYHALRGHGAYRDDRRLCVSAVSAIGESQVFYSGINWFIQAGFQNAFLDLAGRTQRQRGFGDFYGFMLVAQGSGELMLDYGVNAWDVAAVVPIIEEAGGMFTDWEGNRTIHRPDTLASNGLLHAEVLAILRAHWPAGFQPQVVRHQQSIT